MIDKLPSLYIKISTSWRQVSIRIVQIIAVSSLTLLAACGGNEFQYSRIGIGADLYSTDLKMATKNLNTYMGFICDQAELDTRLSENGYPSCIYQNMDSTKWTILVHTGFNDIDRRCDAYLAWLDEVRQREVFGSSQLNVIEGLVRTIKVATNTQSVGAMAIVGAAFGYARSLFSDYHRVIYNGIESSTIKTIVSERRLSFRSSFVDVRIAYKPDAVNLLRSYLRICMPYTITMDANTYARATANGTIAPNQRNPQDVRNTIISENALKPGAEFGTRPPRSENPTTDPVLRQVFAGDGFFVKADLEQMQRVFCLQKQGLGIIGGKTKASIKILETFRATPPGNVRRLNWRKITVDGKIDSMELRDLIFPIGPCDVETRKYANVFESIFYSEDNDTATKITSLGKKLGALLPNFNFQTDGKSFDTGLRSAIAEARKLYPIQDNVYAQDQMSKPFSNWVIRTNPPARI